MTENQLDKIDKLIEDKKVDEAQFELSKLGQKYNKNANYLYLRGKVFYLNKLYYAAIDALLIALEFEKNNKIYNLLAEIYGVLGNNELFWLTFIFVIFDFFNYIFISTSSLFVYSS